MRVCIRTCLIQGKAYSSQYIARVASRPEVIIFSMGFGRNASEPIEKIMTSGRDATRAIYCELGLKSIKTVSRTVGQAIEAKQVHVLCFLSIANKLFLHACFTWLISFVGANDLTSYTHE